MATVVDAPVTQSTAPNWTVPGVLATVPFIATLVSTAQGPGLSPDSVNYLSTGLNLANGQGLTTYSGETLTVFPPGLPAVVAAGELVGLGANWTVRLLNALSFGAIVVLAAVLLARHIADRRLVVGATAFIAVSVALLAVSSMAWTEAPFIVVTLAFILLLERALAEPARWRWVVVCALLVWVAFVLRYAGVSLVAVSGATLLVGLWRTDRGVAVRNAVAFGVLAVAGPLAWMLRNRSVDETLMGPRYPSTDTPVQVGYRIVRTVGGWLIPAPLPVCAATELRPDRNSKCEGPETEMRIPLQSSCEGQSRAGQAGSCSPQSARTRRVAQATSAPWRRRPKTLKSVRLL